MSTSDPIYRQRLQVLLRASEDDLLQELGKELTPPLGARVSSPAELIRRAQLWLIQKQPYFKEKICGNAVIKEDSPEVELALGMFSLLMPHLAANQSLIVTALIVRYGLKALCDDK